RDGQEPSAPVAWHVARQDQAGHGGRHGMRNLDDELKRVLRREEPPDGFAERVLRRVEGEPPAKTSFERVAAGPIAAERPPSHLRWYQLAAAAAVILAIG